MINSIIIKMKGVRLLSRSVVAVQHERPSSVASGGSAAQAALLQMGCVRSLGSGLFAWLPCGLRVVERVASVARRHMAVAGFDELLLPALHSANWWRASNRWGMQEAFTLKDRKERQQLLLCALFNSSLLLLFSSSLLLFSLGPRVCAESHSRGGSHRGFAC
jgi:hypothetical protein